jgi:predicted SnoaL-like aldol condensation-catalyzing enzyme
MTDNDTPQPIHMNRKDSAVDFLQLVVAGRIDEAYGNYVDMDGKHHNPFSPPGFPALQKAMIENHIQFPAKQISVKNVVSDGDLIAVHSHIVVQSGDAGLAAIHIFRFQDGKIAELWDCVQSLPADSPNTDGAF